MKHFLFVLCTLFTIPGIAQHYQLTTTISSYQEITNPTYEIPDSSQYFGNVTTRPDMYFKSFNNQYDLYDNVYIPLKQGYCYFMNATRSTTVYAAKGLFTGRQGSGETSMFSFKTEGPAASRILILQWKNMGFQNGDSADFINFQLNLYEQTGVIEMHFGPNAVKPGRWEQGGNGPTIGLLEMDENFSTIYNQIWLSGTSASPVVNTGSTFVQLSDVPVAGTLYRFTPVTTAISESVLENETRVYPNPSSGIFTLAGTKAGDKVTITGICGDERKIKLQNESINLSNYTDGMYFLRINNRLPRKVMIRH